MSFADAFSQAYNMGRRRRAIEEKSALEKSLEELVGPYVKTAKADQIGSIEANPDYKFGVNNDEIIQARRLGMDTKDYSTMRNSLASVGMGEPVKEVSPINYKAPMGQQEWMGKNGWLLTMLGLKPGALPYAIRTGDENKLSSLVEGGLAESADQKRRNDIYNNRVTAQNQQGALGKAADILTTLNEEGTTGNNLGELTNLVAGNAGLTTPFVFGDVPVGRKDRLADATIAKDNSYTWRNYNKPLVGAGRGGGGGSGGGGRSTTEKINGMTNIQMQNKISKYKKWRAENPDADISEYPRLDQYEAAADPYGNYAQADDIVTQIKAANPDATEDEIFQYLYQTLGYGQ